VLPSNDIVVIICLGKKNQSGRQIPVAIVSKVTEELIQVPLSDLVDSDGKLKISSKASQEFLSEAYKNWSQMTKSAREKQDKRDIETDKFKKTIKDLKEKCDSNQKLLIERNAEVEELQEEKEELEKKK